MWYRRILPDRLKTTSIANDILDKGQQKFLKDEAFSAIEILASTGRKCHMNLFLHNISEIDGTSFISSADALIFDPGFKVDHVLVNPLIEK